jgi:hydrogenase maturation factor HypF (carbamoyltransferase family)
LAGFLLDRWAKSKASAPVVAMKILGGVALSAQIHRSVSASDLRGRNARQKKTHEPHLFMLELFGLVPAQTSAKIG